VFWLLISCSEGEVAADAQPVDLHLLQEYEQASPEAIAHSLEMKSDRGYADFVDLGTTYVWMGDYLKAAEFYEQAARHADTHDDVVGALYNKTGALAYGGRMDMACSTAETVTRLAPENAEAAWLRYALYRYHDDPLGALVAQDHLLHVDPEAAGQEVMDPVTAAVVLGSLAIMAGTFAYVRTVKLVPPDDRAEVVVPMFNAYTGLVGESVQMAPGMIDLGRDLAVR